jgi:hypothetical protein
MDFKTFQTDIERSYDMNNLTHAFFYDDNSINEKFKSYLNNKYKNKVDSYIKPFGFFNWKVDSITSFNFRIGVHGLIGSKYKNKVSIVFEKDDTNKYVLNNNFYGIKKKSSYQILNDVIEFMDNNFQVI